MFFKDLKSFPIKDQVMELRYRKADANGGIGKLLHSESTLTEELVTQGVGGPPCTGHVQVEIKQPIVFSFSLDLGADHEVELNDQGPV